MLFRSDTGSPVMKSTKVPLMGAGLNGGAVATGASCAMTALAVVKATEHVVTLIHFDGESRDKPSMERLPVS